MQIELLAQKVKVKFAAINAIDTKANQKELIDRCSYPLFQDREDIKAWAHHHGQKDDIFVFDSQGKLAYYLPISFSGPDNTDLSTTEGYENLKAKILSVK